MDCEKCKLEIIELFDKNVTSDLEARILEHIEHCPECYNEYKSILDIIEILKPQQLPETPFLLKQNIMNQLKMEENEMTTKKSRIIRLSNRAKKLLSVAAVLALTMLALPIIDHNTNLFNRSVKAANNLIEKSIRAAQQVKSMVITLYVRTLEDDNFSLVGTDYKMVKHSIYKSFEYPEKWRVEKPGRIVVFDGENQYLHIIKAQEFMKASRSFNILEGFDILLEPDRIMMREQSTLNKYGSKLQMEEKDGLVYLTITSKAQGNFLNDYNRNSSIIESDNRREYVFDKETNLLKGLKVFIIDGKKETLILESESIEYNTSIDPLLYAVNIPTGVAFRDLTLIPESDIFKNISSKRAAELFFNGLANSDWDLVGQTYATFHGKTERVEKLKDTLGGLKLVKLGEPFKSGLYAGEYVPYEIRLKSGKTIRHNLALRNDNPNKVWLVDGGF